MANTSNWYVPNEGSSVPGSHTYGGGGGYGGADVLQTRSPLDARRMGHGQLGQAQYPDGYLGSLSQDRQQDKLLDAVQNKLTQRSYQRGVHKGAKVDGRDYFWPQDQDPMRRIRAEANYQPSLYTMNVKRFAPTGNPVERLHALGKTAGLTPPEQMSIARKFGVNPAKNPVVNSDPTAKAHLQKMLPQYARTM